MRFIANICGLILVFSFYFVSGQDRPRIWDTRDGLSNNWISDIEQDELTSSNDYLYVATDKGLFIKMPNKDDIEQVFEEKVIDIRQNSEGLIFFLSSSALYTYNSTTHKYEKVIDNPEEKIQRIFIDSEDRLYCLKNNALFNLRLSNGSYSIAKTLQIDQLVSLRFADNPIVEDSEHRIWIGGKKGISIVNKNRNAVEFHPYTSFFEKDMVGVQALSFFEDVHKNMWIGTNKGLGLISTFSTRFQSANILPDSIPLNDIREFYQVNEKKLIASNEGLYLVTKEKNAERVLSEKIYGMHMADSGKLYAIGYGLFEIDTTSFNVKEITNTYFKGGWSIAEDKKGNLWMVSGPNLIRYHMDSGTIETFSKDMIPTLHNSPRLDLIIDSEERLWVCTLKSGVFVLDNPHELALGETPVFKNINHVPGNTKSLSNRLATNLMEASDGTIWIGTDAGLNAVNPKTFVVKRYLKNDGLKDEKIMALVEDDFGNIWGSTVGNGIFQLNPKTAVFNFFGQEDGLKSSNFLLSSAFKNKDGLLFFGTDNGVEVINPILIKDFIKPKIDFFFTSIELSSLSEDNQIKPFETDQSEFIFDHNESSFKVNYTTLNYHLAEKTNYKYKVDKLNKTWQNNGNERSITFNSLPPGKYSLEVKAINPDLDFTSDTIRLKFTIKPPWWSSNLAFISYFLLLISLAFVTHKYLLNRRLERAEKNRLQELDTFKTKFFNNVAHELKTPLTIILGMARNLRKKRKNEIDKSANIIIRNSEELNDLINQILDLSKLEVGKLDLDMAHGDIILYLKYLLSSFESLASAKEIRLHFLGTEDTLYMDFDAQKVKHILTNLVSNAIKNTHVKGDVYLQVSQEGSLCQFIVKDNGVGISKEELKFIFDRYHQGKDQLGGTGIGLSFIKELITLMNGAITVESKLGHGSSFKVSLPVVHNTSKDFSYDNNSGLTGTNKNGLLPNPSTISGELPVIQIIEDNLDICSYLGFILKQDYQLHFDHSGDSGLKNILETVPDLVITDLMLPGKHGFEVCHEIKSDPITDHIPVIMLTAKSDAESKLQGLQHGADVYLEKPFDEKELLLRIEKLLEQRELLREKFRNTEFWDGATGKTNGKTNHFVEKVKKLIEENIDDSSFGILHLCRSLGISRSHLHRKLKALTDLSTTAFVQTVKLQKAHQLLKTSNKNVSEVAYEVGFEDPAYFSRLYSKTFGHPPSETRKDL